MPHPSSSQPASSKSLYRRSRGESSRDAGRSNDLFRGISLSFGRPSTASSQPASSSRLERTLTAERRDRQAAENDDAARKAARQKRRQYEPYQVRGWESLYGGGGSGSRSSHRSSSSSKQQKESSSGGGSSSKNGATSSSLPLSRSNRAPASSSSGRSQSPSKKHGSSKTSNAQLPPSTAPSLSRDRRSEASPTGLAKRKARSSASQPSPTKKARASTPPGRQSAAQVASDDSDSDFEVVSINGQPPPPLPPKASRAATVKASPSPIRVLKSSQPTQRGVLRRSESRAASSGRPSPAIPSSPSPAAQERPPSVLPSASQSSMRTDGSRASSEASSSGTTLESREKELERQEIILAALKRGSSFADQIRAVTLDFIATPSSSQSDLEPVEVFQRKVANLGTRLKSRDVTLAKKEVPVALQMRLGSVLAAWHQYRKEIQSDGQDDVERNNSTTSAPASSISQNTATTVPTTIAPAMGVAEQSRTVQRPAESEEVQKSADSLQGPDRNEDAGAQSPDNALAHHPEVAPADTNGDDADGAAAGLDVTADSAGSPEAYGTPPEQPMDDTGDAESEAAAVVSDPEPEEFEGNAPSGDQHELPASSQIEEEEEEDEVAEEGAADDELAEQHQTQPGSLEGQDESELEDELVDELMDDEPTDAAGGNGAAIAPEDMHEDLQVSTVHDNAINASSSTQIGEHAARADPSSGSTDVEQATDTLQESGSQADPGTSVAGNPPETCGDASTEATAEADAVADVDQAPHTAEAAQPSEQPMHEERQVATEGGEQVSAMNEEDEQQTGSTNEQIPEPARISAVEQEAETRDGSQDDQTHEQQEQDVAPAPDDERTDNVIDDTPALGSELAAAGGVPENVTGGLNTPVDPMTDQVATAVEAVENALAAECELFPADPEDAPVIAQDDSTGADEQVQVASAADTTVCTPADDADAVAGASDAVTMATPSVPSPARAADADAHSPAAVELTSIEIPDTSGDDNAPSASSAQRSPQQSAAISTSEASAELQEVPLTAAAAAVSALDDAVSNEEIISDLFAQASNEASVARQGETAVPSVGATEPTTAPTPATAETHLEATADEAARNHARESSQAASDTPATSRPKRKVDDRMRSMLRDLANVTGRRSSYRTIQKLKPLRAGFSTPETVSDLVNNWQEPSKIIPWTCLQELGPAIFHRNAHRHLHLSMHELMDRVSSTRSVTHLTERVPERVIARALMEFPRIPHMLHCWNEEKIKYYWSRGLPQPTDTQPEFRFADQDGGSVVAPSRASAPPSSTASPMLEERKPRTERGGSQMSAASTSASVTTQSNSVQTPHPSAVMNNPALDPAAPPAHSLQAQSQSLTKAGNQLLVEHLARNQQRAPASPAVQQLRQHILGNQDIRPEYRAHIAGASGRAPPVLQQPTIRQAFQQQTAQTSQPAALTPFPANIERYREHLVQAQRAQQVQQLLAVQQQAAQQQAQQQAQRQQQQLSATRQAALVKQATDSVFTELAADCLSFAEHVIGSRGTGEVNLQRHFSEADVLHVVDFVVATYRREVDGQDAGRAQESLGKISAVRAVAVEVLNLTQTLCYVKMCLNEVAMESLRSTDRAETRGWLERLRTGGRWEAVRRVLLQDEAGAVGVLSAGEVELLLGRQVEVLSRRLEGMLERLMGVGELVGAVCEEAEREAREGMRKECEQIGLICCKHVVGVLVGEPEVTRG